MKEQYELVRESRKVLFEFCTGITFHDLTRENSSFGRGSIRNLLVHIADVYEFWIGGHGLKKDVKFTRYDLKVNMGDIIRLFDSVDVLVFEFFDYIEKNKINEIEYERNGITKNVTPLKLFTHVITHEFHHKGQILSLSRHLGYKPIDTDIIR